MTAQILANTVITAAIYTLVGLSFGMIYSVARFFHIAHGVMFTAGAYFLYFFYSVIRLPIALAGGLSICATAILGWFIYITLHKNLEKSNASPLIHFIASLGLYVVIENVLSITFGDESIVIRSASVTPGHLLLGAHVTSVQVLMILLTSLSIFILIALSKTKMSLTLRAIANDPDLAECIGIDRKYFVGIAFAQGSALIGLAGCLVAYDISVRPTMGMNFLIMGIVAVLVGGASNILGITISAILLSGAQQAATLFISAQWHDAIAFIVLFLVLLLRPNGLLAGKQ